MTTNIGSDAFILTRPFRTAADHVLSGWWQACQLFCSEKPEAWLNSDFAVKVSRAFAPLGGPSGKKDPHLATGHFDTLRAKGLKVAAPVDETYGGFTRPYALLLEHFRQPQIQHSMSVKLDAVADKQPKQYLCSPLLLLRQLLTSPSYPASAGYAHAVVRSEIFAAAVTFDESRLEEDGEETKLTSATEKLRSLIEFNRISASLQEMESQFKKRDTFHPSTATDLLVGHFLAARGLALLSFSPGKARLSKSGKRKKNEKAIVGRDAFLRDRQLVPKLGIYEFRMIEGLERIPTASEIVNEIDGFPLPMPGIDVVFARGIRSTTGLGVVGRVSGAAGTGKTSLALSMATVLAPLGVTCLYLSCEEEKVDLEKRIVTLTPPFVARTASFPRILSKWFHAEHLDSNEPRRNWVAAKKFIDDILTLYESEDLDPSKDAPPGLVPLMLVIDGVHELLQHATLAEELIALRELTDRARKLGAFVIVLTAESTHAALHELDYMVDFVIKLENLSDVADPDNRVRRINLQKTRLQYSRTGSHIFHISKQLGVSIYPQLAAQLDVVSSFKWRQTDRSKWYDLMAYERPAKEANLLKVFERSHVVVTGKGSGGKSGFALYLLMQPFHRDKYDETPDLFALESKAPHRFADPRPILIVSFLYQEEYYEELKRKIRRNMPKGSGNFMPSVEIEVLSLYPGYLSPEVFFQKILARIERRALEGTPFQGVIIDGLHNIFLQFPRLQQSKMIWPTLFEYFRILGLTVVVTSTNFDVKGMERGGLMQIDVELSMQRVAPLLQALINSSDYYLDISPEATPNGGVRLPIEVVSALDSSIGMKGYCWDREKLRVTREES